ncbi:angiogenic factor with G patch and FHA domains 1 [Latimeria chalumnae]|nr:PREDICTED: angiogenic factor with G patch and FHA domains 1 isoform X1 [Latimeria chalumnae]|eukprot:XP_005992687.1 PREDICTED: angiogenic factor with G patch and FHA domains 1 isoform X1 [Latimeria chalumnae]
MASNEDTSTSEPEPELKALQQKVETLEQELTSCKNQLHKLQKQLNQTERLYKNTESYNEDLRKQVEELSKEIHDRKKKDRSKADVEVQTDDYLSCNHTDHYYYHNYYQSSQRHGDPSELPVEANGETEVQDHCSRFNTASTVCPDDGAAKEEVAHTDASLQSLEETEGVSLAESLRATAEAVVSQTGFTYDENSGMYYDHSTGFYYDSTNQLYYDPATGIYYYFDAESGRYQFHSRVDLQSYQALNAEPFQEKKGKRRRRGGSEKPAAKEDKDFKSEEQIVSKVTQETTPEKINFSEKAGSAKPKRPKFDSAVKSAGQSGEEEVETVSIASSEENTLHGNTHEAVETDSEPEEGEITDSEKEENWTDDEEEMASEESEDLEDIAEAEEMCLPCIRVIVVRSPVLQTGTLFIITAVKSATIGREKDMEHAIRIPEIGVSKFHAEVYFDQELQSYVLVDQGSQNGTVINGNRILQPKAKCDPYVLEHGDEVKIGETVLSFHVHSGNETCYGCEPGQVLAHLGLHKKEEAAAQLVFSKEEKESVRRKELKQMRVKYGLQNSEYEENKALKNPKYKDRAGKRRQKIGSEGTFKRDDAPASVHVEIGNQNKGRKMLEKMGWKKGEGLGKDGSGMKDPIQLQLRKSHAGLGASVPASVEDLEIVKSKNQKNWEKARERFSETFQQSDTKKKEAVKPTTWIKGSTE